MVPQGLRVFCNKSATHWFEGADTNRRIEIFFCRTLPAAVLPSTPFARACSGIAVFLLVSGVGVLVGSTVAMALFFRERNAFEIRAR